VSGISESVDAFFLAADPISLLTHLERSAGSFVIGFLTAGENSSVRQE
jgi:hypothetical protein